MDDDFNKAYSAELTEDEKKEIEKRATKSTGNMSIEDRLRLQEHMFRTKKAMSVMDKEKFASTIANVTEAMEQYYCNDSKILRSAFENFRITAVKYHMAPDGIKLIDVIGSVFIYPMEAALDAKRDNKRSELTKEINNALLMSSEEEAELKTNADWLVEVST